MATKAFEVSSDESYPKRVSQLVGIINGHIQFPKDVLKETRGIEEQLSMMTLRRETSSEFYSRNVKELGAAIDILKCVEKMVFDEFPGIKDIYNRKKELLLRMPRVFVIPSKEAKSSAPGRFKYQEANNINVIKMVTKAADAKANDQDNTKKLLLVVADINKEIKRNQRLLDICKEGEKELIAIEPASARIPMAIKSLELEDRIKVWELARDLFFNRFPEIRQACEEDKVGKNVKESLRVAASQAD